MLKDLIERALPDLDGALTKQLLRDLEETAEGIAVSEGAKLVARGLVKGIDGVAAVAFKNLSPSEADRLIGAYAVTVRGQLDQLMVATVDYVPLAMDVERNKNQFGKNSAEANAARKRREVGITEMRQEVRDILLAATGDEPAD